MRKLFLVLSAVTLMSSYIAIDLIHIDDIDYYYYRGEKRHLDINESVLIVKYIKTETGKYLENKYGLKPGGVVGADKLGPVQLSDSSIECVYTVRPSEYRRIYQSLRNEENVTNVIRVVGKDAPMVIPGDFYIDLEDDVTVEEAKELAEELGVEFIGYSGFGRWYELRCNNNSVGDALVCSSLFYESGMCKAIDPGFGYGFNIVYGSISDNGAAYQFDIEKDNIFYTIHEDGLYVSVQSVFVRDVEASYSGEIEIPGEVITEDTVYKVVGVDCYAFYGCDNLVSLTFPESVINFEPYCMSACPSLKNVSISGQTTVLPRYMFYNSPSIETVQLPGSVRIIEPYAFSGCSSITNMKIPDQVETIPEYAFEGCSALKEIVIGNSVNSIGKFAFSGCSSLRELNIPEGVKSLGNGMIEHCNNLKYLTIPESVENQNIESLFFIAQTALAPMVGKPDTINLNLFEHRNHIRYVQGEITIYKKGIEYIHSFPVGILSLPENGLFRFMIGSDIDSIPDFFQYSSEWLLKSYMLERMESLYIPESVKYIGTSAFCGCTNLKEVVIGGSPVIGEYAFAGCDSIGRIVLSGETPPEINTVFSLSANVEAEDWDQSLSKVVKLDRTVPLEGASGGCASYFIEDGAFNWTISFQLDYAIPGWYDVKLKAVPNKLFPEVEGVDNAEDVKPAILAVTVKYTDKDGVKQSYTRKDPSNSRKSFTFVMDGDSIMTLDAARLYFGDMKECGERQMVTLEVKSQVTNSNAKKYSHGVWIDCVSLELVSLAGPSADFTPEDKLEELDLSPAVRDSLTEAMCQTIFSRNVFENALLSVPENAVSDYLNSMLWKHFNNMEGYVSGGYDTDLGNDSIYFNLYHGAAFVAAREVSREKFRGIFGFDGPLTPRDPIAGGLQPRSPLRAFGRHRTAASNDVLDTEGSAFYRGNIIIPESVMFDNTTYYSVSGIDYYAFMGCRELESVTIPESVTKLGYGSFAGCIGLNTIVLPSGVENIPDALFYGCIRLDNVIIPDGVDTIGHSAFYECAGLTEIVIPASVELIDEYAFYGCTGLKRIVIEGNPEIAPTAFLGCGTGLEIIKTGIESIDVDHHEVYGPVHYGIDGRPVAPDAPGLHIIRMPDGRMKKALILWK